MLSFANRIFVGAAIIALATGLPAFSQPLTKVQIAKKGKASTVLVEVPSGTASAFCIHPSGLFITNAHTFRDGSSSIKLIVDPALKSQRILKARLLRSDTSSDLAIVRAEGKADVPVLPLADDDKVAELMEVIAIGFPFGKRLALNKGEYPAVSVNLGAVTSLRYKERKLHRIQLDAVLNPGNSGGPVLDNKGKVVGVVVSGVLGAQVNFAIPVRHVRNFLAQPAIDFSPPNIGKANLHQAVEFKATASEFTPSKEPLALEIIVTRNGLEQTYKMTREKDVFRAKVIPIPVNDDKPKVHIDLMYKNGRVRGRIIDQLFQIGDHKIQLASVAKLHFAPNASATLVDGKTITGKLSGLDKLQIDVGGQRLGLTLMDAVDAKLTREVAQTVLNYSLVAKRGGKEVLRITGSTLTVGPKGIASTSRFGGLLTATDAFDKIRSRCHSKSKDVYMSKGMVYVIDLVGQFDTFLRLEDSAGANVAQDDDGGVGLNSRIIFRPKSNGTHRVVVTSCGSGQTGPYTLTIRSLQEGEQIPQAPRQ